MVDRDVIWAKLSSLTFHLERVQKKRDVPLESFLRDIDRQESVLFNLQAAIQDCIDLAAHVVSDERLGVPAGTSELFYLLEQRSVIEPELAEKMVRAVGFGNLIVHEYGRLDLGTVCRVAQEDLADLESFARAIARRFPA